jgi:hypothetical protein
MNILGNIRQRVSGVVVGVIVAIGVFICGTLMAFVISPQQALEWRRIDGLPLVDGSGFASAAAETELVVTGRLEGNQPLTEDGLVAYAREQWEVDPPDNSNDDPDGSWTVVEESFPALTLNAGGSPATVTTLPATSVTFGGAMHETIQEGTGTERADYSGRSLPEGSIRTRGYQEGDLITVVGRKSTTGELVPARYYGGDRVQLVEEIRNTARALFAVGVGMMICAPILLVAVVLGSIFGRVRGGGGFKIKG